MKKQTADLHLKAADDKTATHLLELGEGNITVCNRNLKMLQEEPEKPA
jgi:hypothetical protein